MKSSLLKYRKPSFEEYAVAVETGYITSLNGVVLEFGGEKEEGEW